MLGRGGTHVAVRRSLCVCVWRELCPAPLRLLPRPARELGTWFARFIRNHEACLNRDGAGSPRRRWNGRLGALLAFLPPLHSPRHAHPAGTAQHAAHCTRRRPRRTKATMRRPRQRSAQWSTHWYVFPRRRPRHAHAHAMGHAYNSRSFASRAGRHDGRRGGGNRGEGAIAAEGQRAASSRVASRGRRQRRHERGPWAGRRRWPTGRRADGRAGRPAVLDRSVGHGNRCALSLLLSSLQLLLSTCVLRSLISARSLFRCGGSRRGAASFWRPASGL